jgi:hypothetical protein
MSQSSDSAAFETSKLLETLQSLLIALPEEGFSSDAITARNRRELREKIHQTILRLEKFLIELDPIKPRR